MTADQLANLRWLLELPAVENAVEDFLVECFSQDQVADAMRIIDVLNFAGVELPAIAHDFAPDPTRS